MEILFEILFEFIIVWVVSYPVAFLRWAITGFKKGMFEEYVFKDGYVNFLLFSLIILFIVIMVKLFKFLFK